MIDEENGLILVIDDEPESAALLKRCLANAGRRVATSSTAAQAWQVLEREPVSLVVVDYRLRGAETGIDFLQRLQAAGKRLPVIVVSAFGSEEVVVEAFRLGASDYVPKTAAIGDQLPRVVERVLNQLRSEAQLRRADEERQHLVARLTERVKEMAYLHQVSSWLQDSQIAADQLLQQVVDLLPSAFQDPAHTSARIQLGERCWASPGFTETERVLRQPIAWGDMPAGLLEVCTPEDAARDADASTFLPEESTLLKSLADMLGLHFERQSAFDQLRQSERRYRSLIEASALVVWKADAAGKISSIQPVLAAPTNEEEAQSLGDGWVNMVHPDDAPQVMAEWQKSVRDQTPHYASFRVRRHNGQSMHVESRAIPVFDESGDAVEWVGTLHDVTERVESQAVYSRLAAIVASTDDAVISKTTDGAIISWNPGAERLFGYRAEEVLGSHIKRIIPESLQQEHQELLERIAEGQRLRNFETVRLRKNGTPIDVSMSVSPVLDKAGRVVGISAIARDISARKAAELRRQAQAAVLQTIAGAYTVPQAAEAVIQALCNCYGWEGGCFWQIDDSAETLRLAAHWFRQREPAAEFVAHSRQMEFGRGQCLPGEAWERREPVWVVDFHRQPHFPRARLAEALQWHGALAFPLQIGPQFLGVIEVFDRDVRRPRADDLALLGSLCTQFALFIEQKEIESSRTRLANILEASTDLVATTDPSGKLLFVNRGGRNMVGIGDEEYIPEIHFSRLCPEWAWKKMRDEGFPAAIERGDWTAETVLLGKQGREIPVSQLLLAHKDASGKVEFFSTIIRDMSEQKEAEQSLRLSQRALAAASEGIVITGPLTDDCPVLSANEAFHQITGYSLDDIAGRNLRILQGAESDPAAVAEMRQAILEERSCTVELVNYRADSTPFWSLVSITPVRDDAGFVTHFVGALRDTTQRRQMEQRLRQTQKMEAVGNLASGIAHDFNNLLTIILGYGEMAREAIPTGAPATPMLDKVLATAQRASTLTGQLLAFSRQQALELQQLNINHLIGDLQRLLRPILRDNVQLATELADDLWTVRVDPSQFEQVLLNLVINARDAMPDGGQVAILTRNLAIGGEGNREHPDVPSGDYVMLGIRDTGIGMKPEILSRIFEPFFTTKPKGKGTGMGLATAYGSVKQSGGHIGVTSHPGQGSTFRIYLPRCEATERPDSSTKKPTEALNTR